MGSEMCIRDRRALPPGERERGHTCARCWRICRASRAARCVRYVGGGPGRPVSRAETPPQLLSCSCLYRPTCTCAWGLATAGAAAAGESRAPVSAAADGDGSPRGRFCSRSALPVASCGACAAHAPSGLAHAPAGPASTLTAGAVEHAAEGRRAAPAAGAAQAPPADVGRACTRVCSAAARRNAAGSVRSCAATSSMSGSSAFGSARSSRREVSTVPAGGGGKAGAHGRARRRDARERRRGPRCAAAPARGVPMLIEGFHAPLGGMLSVSRQMRPAVSMFGW